MKNKLELYTRCKEQLEQKVKEIEHAIAERREAIKNDTKSSMGDKYETSREMLQQDINMNMTRLSKLRAEEAVLNRINPETTAQLITDGSLVETNNGSFYIAISAGKLKLDNQLYYAISISSPIGMQLKGKKEGDTFSLNNRKYIIEKVH